MRRMLVVVALVALTAAGAQAANAKPTIRGRYAELRHKAAERFGRDEVRLNLLRGVRVRHEGVLPPDKVLPTMRPATRGELRRAVSRFKRKLYPPAPQHPQVLSRAVAPVTAAPAGQAQPVTGGGGGGGNLGAIAQCESGGDPGAIGGGGQFRGKYQFTRGTWESVGGSGDPAAAPEGEQDKRAAMLYQQSGSSPWPVCGQ